MALTVMERVEAGSIPEPNSGCWLWLGRAHEAGRKHEYGVFSVGNKRTSVHRAAYEAAHGAIPKGMVCRHTCDNASCVNPDHLVVGTQADNVRDMWERKRAHQQIDPSVGQRAATNGNATMAAEPHRRARGDRHGKKAGGDKGEKNSQAVLTELAIAEIRLSPLPQRTLARQYGVHQKTIWRVKNDKSWTHVPALKAPGLPEVCGGTSIYIDIPDGLLVHQKHMYIAGHAAAELSRYLASECLQTLHHQNQLAAKKAKP